ncbi:MAG: sigma-E processing peptidase SpoIIGA [Clostridia bacterium]|nr:sigma-E processing peptidase SpoIIGA [Clostridia bacterium]
MITVYIDVLFGINFLINILIVEGTAAIISEDIKWYRSLLAAFLGSVYAVAVFFPSMGFAQSLAMKILLSALMVVCAFKIKNGRHFVKLLGCFYLVSFIFGGGIIAVMSMTRLGSMTGAVYSNGTVYFNLPWKVLIGSAAGVYFMVYMFGRIRKKRLAKVSLSRKLTIYINGNSVSTNAIIDTGNSLFDPITGKPVIVCEYAELKGVVPEADNGSLVEKMSRAGLKVRLIPFSSIGREKGLMPGFMPDMVLLDGKEVKSCVVGISEIPLSSRAEYHALLNPSVIINE